MLLSFVASRGGCLELSGCFSIPLLCPHPPNPFSGDSQQMRKIWEENQVSAEPGEPVHRAGFGFRNTFKFSGRKNYDTGTGSLPAT